MLKKLTILIAGILLITACNTPSSEPTKKVETESLQLHLNQGKKWIANKETHLGMGNLQKLLNETPDSTNFDALAIKMKEETQYIISNCNMTGEDHDQLHLVLLPILNEIKAVNNASGTVLNNTTVDKIKKNLADYFNHFTVK